MPIAIEILERDPLTQGDFYPGDLLGNVLRVDPSFWDEHPDYRRRVESLLKDAEVPRKLNEAVAAFRRSSVVPSA